MEQDPDGVKRILRERAKQLRQRKLKESTDS
jgi:hypothetical protein